MGELILDGSTYQFIILFAIILPAAFLHGLVGFGFGLIVIPLASLMFPIEVMVPFVTLIGFALNFGLILKLPSKPKSPEVYYLLAGSLIGTIPGVIFLKIVEPLYAKILIALVLISYSLYSLFARKRILIQLPAPLGTVAGMVGAFLGSGMAASGPPIIIFTTIQPWLKNQIKATNTMYLFCTGFLSVASHVGAGLTTEDVLIKFAIIGPIALFASWVGSCYFDKIDHELFGKIAFSVLLAIGLILLTVSVTTLLVLLL
ncbi:MAG: sulfite exporter TauE/SafE family protein [Nitrospinota bacterium]